jgi:hypothetical protein
VTAGFDNPDLLLYLILADRQLVSTIGTHHLLVFLRTARKPLFGRRRWLVLGRRWLHNAYPQVETDHAIIHLHEDTWHSSDCNISLAPPMLSARLLLLLLLLCPL